jgi:acid phosphatase type 7
MVVRWRTDNTEPSSVRYGLAANQLTLTAKSEGISTEHVVQLTKLQPNTRYYYAPVSGNDKPAKPGAEDGPPSALVSSFVTPPVTGPAQPTRVWVLGDPGTKTPAQIAVRDAYYKFKTAPAPPTSGSCSATTPTPTAPMPNIRKLFLKCILVCCAPLRSGPRSATTTAEAPTHSLNPVYTTTSSSLPTMGQAGGVPSGTEAYYSFDHANIHFICLDSNDSPRDADGAMAQWLRADLAATTRDWIVAFFHHPTYTKGTHDSDKDTDSGGPHERHAGQFPTHS